MSVMPSKFAKTDSLFKKISLRFLSLSFVLVMLAGLLVACGEENKTQTDNSFTFPVYNGLNELTALSNSAEFADKVTPKDQKFSEKSVRVFTTNTALSDVKGYYQRELVNLGWNDRSTTLIGPTTLATDGWVLGFEKPAGNSAGRSRGMIMVGPNVNGTDNFLKQYRDNGTIPPNTNVLVVVDGLYLPSGTPSAPTATPKA
jgi:hypothetical protein